MKSRENLSICSHIIIKKPLEICPKGKMSNIGPRDKVPFEFMYESLGKK